MTDQPATILVLNDSPENLNLLRDVLTDAGFAVETGLKPLTTVDELIAIAPDLLVLDFLWDHDRRGWELVQLVREDPRTQDMPVLLCTTGGPALSGLRAELYRLHVGVLLKPFQLDDLVNSVRSLLKM